MDSFIDGTYRVFRLGLRWIIGYGASILMLGITGLAIMEIVRRYIFGVVYEWSQDAVTYGMVAAIFLFFAVTQARRSHLAMTALLDTLRSRGYLRTVLLLRAVVTSISLALFIAFADWGMFAIERAQATGRLTQSMWLLIWPFQLILVIGFVLMAVATLFQLYQDLQALRGKTVFPWAPVEEGLDI